MPTVHTRYVTYARAGRRRHAGSAASDIVTPLSTSVPSGGTYQAFAAPSITWTSNNQQQSASFAFWSVTGAADGNSVSMNPSLSVNIGNSDATVLAWYIPAGGNGHGGPGIYIDAFDVNAGWFVDDDFVSVSPDSGLTAAANDDGWVPTASAENINAYNTLPEGPFTNWNVFAGSEVVNNLQLQAALKTSAVAFAFYQAPASKGVPIGVVHVPAESTWVSYGVMVDAGGPTGHGPVDPWGPYLRDFAAGLALAQAAALVHADLRAEVRSVAARQIKSAAAQITEHLEK